MGNKNSSVVSTSNNEGDISSPPRSGLRKVRIDGGGSTRKRWQQFSICSQTSNISDDYNAIDWLQHIKHECIELDEFCGWSGQVLYAIKQFEGYPPEYYQNQLQRVHLMRSNRQRPSLQPTTQTNDRLGDLVKQSKDYLHTAPAASSVDIKQAEPFAQASINASGIKENSINESNQDNFPRSKAMASMLSSSMVFNASNVGMQNSNIYPSYAFPQFQLYKRQQQQQQQQPTSIVTTSDLNQLEDFVIKCETIKKHLSDSNHVLSHVIAVFTEIFTQSYEVVSQTMIDIRLKEVSQSSKTKSRPAPLSQEFTQLIDKAIREVQQFIRVIQETIDIFYDLSSSNSSSGGDSEEQGYFSREILLNFSTACLFADSRVYDITFRLLRVAELEAEESIKVILRDNCHKNPQDFYIQDKLCLNAKTVKYYRDKNLLEMPYKNLDLNEGKASDKQTKGLRAELKSEGYYRSMAYLLKIEDQQSPISKLRMIVKASENISLSIEAFKEKIGVVNTKKNDVMSVLDADDVLGIFTYITTKCSISQLHTHISFINKFITTNILHSVSGYYLTTLAATLMNLEELTLQNHILGELEEVEHDESSREQSIVKVNDDEEEEEKTDQEKVQMIINQQTLPENELSTLENIVK